MDPSGGGGGQEWAQSPMEFKGEIMQADPNSPGLQQPVGGYGSPSSGIGSPMSGGPPATAPSNSYPPNHPLSGSKHFCTICGDRASGKHYGVYSCEGCKGFFKRTVRKELEYNCRENQECVIDKRQRNRCQYCRYQKCMATGMRREAVQDERNRGRDAAPGGGGGGGTAGGSGADGTDNTVASPAGAAAAAGEDPSNGGDAASNGPANGNGELGIDGESMSIDRIREAEELMLAEEQQLTQMGDNVTKQGLLKALYNWAERIPFFQTLNTKDKKTLIKFGWNELLIAAFSFRSTQLTEDGIKLSDGMIITREEAHTYGVGEIFERVIQELIAKMREVDMDIAELGCLRAIVLFNPDARNLDPGTVSRVEGLRDKVFVTLEKYCKSKQLQQQQQQLAADPQQLRTTETVNRFAKLLLRLPALRSIGLKCVEHLFFFKLIRDDDKPLFQYGWNNRSSSSDNNGSNGDGNGNSSRTPDMSAIDVFIQDILDV